MLRSEVGKVMPAGKSPSKPRFATRKVIFSSNCTFFKTLTRKNFVV